MVEGWIARGGLRVSPSPLWVRIPPAVFIRPAQKEVAGTAAAVEREAGPATEGVKEPQSWVFDS